ncbi:MAG TPA: hypothetical protein VFQ61_13650 [Polyangiaceae bacterium]|nr:hypothetical protein [Polyangiaceae bacterium]
MKPVAIPLLPCRSLDDVLPFYEALGFEVTQRQERPNAYAAMRWRGTDLHLFGVASHEASKNNSMCLLIVDEVEVLHARFAEALRRQLGKVPSQGAPRLTRMKPNQTRFTAVDPAGNSVLFVRRGEPDPHEESRRLSPSLSPLGKAIRAAEVLQTFKNDDEAAIKVLQTALRKAAQEDSAERERALALLEQLRNG